MRSLSILSGGAPSSVTRPESGLKMSSMTRMAVVLPAPLGPSSPKISPGPTSNDTSSTARVSPNDLERCSTETDGAGMRPPSPPLVFCQSMAGRPAACTPQRNSRATGHVGGKTYVSGPDAGASAALRRVARDHPVEELEEERVARLEGSRRRQQLLGGLHPGLVGAHRGRRLLHQQAEALRLTSRWNCSPTTRPPA